MNNPAIDWSLPQRQSPAALFIIFFKVVRSMLRLLWPFLLLYIFRGRKGNLDSFELLIVLLPLFLLVTALLEFIYYRFYIINNELTIKKGIFRKQTIAVPLEKIQAVHLEHTFLHNILGIARISFDSAGTEKMEIKIDALERAKAESLKGFIMQSGSSYSDQVTTSDETLIRLNFNDLLKLSISSNHLEAFFLLLGFLFSIFDNTRELLRNQLNKLFHEASVLFINNTVTIFFILLIFSLIIAIIISTAKTFLTYFNFSISRNENGFRIHSGLFNVKEKVVPFKKIQYISWRANWIRRKIGLSLMRFHSIGGDDIQQRQQIKFPVTQYSFIKMLTLPYQPLTAKSEGSTHTIHPSYAVRKLIWPALPIALLLIMMALPWWHWNALWLLLLLPYSYFNAYLFLKHYRLSLEENSMFIHKGVLGMEEILLKWNNIQKITLQQSLYQRKHQLANIKIHTAGGAVTIPYITLELAHRICNYSLYKIESAREEWM